MTRTSTPTIPTLSNGDRLSREEFHRRYLAMPHVKKAERIDGAVQGSSGSWARLARGLDAAGVYSSLSPVPSMVDRPGKL